MAFPELKMAAWHAAMQAHVKYDLSASSAQSASIADLLEWSDAAARVLWTDFCGDNVKLGYNSPLGMSILRNEIARWYGISPEHCLTFAGAVEAIFCACATLLSESDEVVLITPGFEPLWAIPEALKCKVTKVPLDYSVEKDNSWSLDLNKVEQALHSLPKLLIVNFPNNPTGMTISEDDMKGIIELVDKKGIWLLSDEVFRGLEYNTPSLPSFASLYHRAISIGVLSKALGLGGVRVGWAACQDQTMLQQMLNRKFYFSVCNGQADEILATLALRARETILWKNNLLIQENLKALKVFFQQHSELLSCAQPQSGCTAFPQFNERSKHTSCEDLVKSSGIKLLPGHLFSEDKALHFRIGFGYASFNENLCRLSKAFSLLQ